MARRAQRLPVRRVPELAGIAAVWLNVVDLGRQTDDVACVTVDTERMRAKEPQPGGTPATPVIQPLAWFALSTRRAVGPWAMHGARLQLRAA